MALVFVPETNDPQGRRLDIAGFVLGALTLASLSFAVIEGEASGYGTWWITGLFALGVLAGVAFVVVERRVKSPMLDLSLFRRAPFAGSNFVAFAAYFGTFSIFFFTALYVQVVAGASAYQAAVDFLPMAIGLIVASAVTGPWVAASGPRIPMTVGCLLAAGGIGAAPGPRDLRLPAAGRRRGRHHHAQEGRRHLRLLSSAANVTACGSTSSSTRASTSWTPSGPSRCCATPRPAGPTWSPAW